MVSNGRFVYLGKTGRKSMTGDAGFEGTGTKLMVATRPTPSISPSCGTESWRQGKPTSRSRERHGPEEGVRKFEIRNHSRNF